MGTITLLHKPDLNLEEIIYEPTVVATWVEFVKEGERRAELPLGEELESFLVFTLMRLVKKTDIFSFVVATDYLDAINTNTGKTREVHLSEIGDICLIHAGLFPERHERFGIHPSYFRSIGSAAFDELGSLLARKGRSKYGDLYQRAADGFPFMTEVLLATRKDTDYLDRYSLLKL